MRVAYIFATSGHTASYKLQQMILPQLEDERHGADIAAMFFFDDNNYIFCKNNITGLRLVNVAKENNILLMMCDQCALERGLANVKIINEEDIPENIHDEAVVADYLSDSYKTEINPTNTVDDDYLRTGCFPDLYNELSDNPPDYMISL